MLYLINIKEIGVVGARRRLLPTGGVGYSAFLPTLEAAKNDQKI